MRDRGFLAAILVALIAQGVGAQKRVDTVAARQAILIAEDRRAPSPRDLATIRTGLRSKDADTIRIAARALGRLERPNLIPDILPLLKSPWPEVRAEAANAVGQAAQGWKEAPARRSAAVRMTGGVRTPNATGADSAAAVAVTLITWLRAEDEPSVRAALCQTIGRLPYATGGDMQRAEAALIETLSRDASVDGRVGVAQGIEALVRVNAKMYAPSADAVAHLRELAAPASAGVHPKADLTRDAFTNNGMRDARVRRLALEALIAANGADDETIVSASGDGDAQVRRLAMRAASASGRPLSDAVADALKKGLSDPSPMVRIDALRGERVRGGPAACASAIAASHDADPHVALLALDQLAPCAASPDAVATLERTLNDLSQAGVPRGWHRGAHAIVALAAAAPTRAKPALGRFASSRVWQLRVYAARAATLLEDQAALEALAADADDNVCEAAIDGLSRVAGHAADAHYIHALGRHGYQAVRAAARALAAAPPPPVTALPALTRALQRLTAEGRDNSRDARAALVDVLQALGEPVQPVKPVRDTAIASAFDAADLRRLASARARITIRGVGAFELVLFSTEAPASVARFARLAESGYYNGLTFHRVVPTFVIQGGSPGANEYVGDAAFMRDEVGLWPHVRGAVGISTRGRDTGDAQIFIDLVDNPRLDHDYTVFAQVLRGMDVVDQILEGDLIERIDIVLGS